MVTEMEDINVIFIIPKNCGDENDCPEEMLLAFTTCEQHCGGGLQAKWEYETKWKQFEGLTKRNVFVLSEFEGELFDKLKTTKCLIVGPRCLSCCLTEGTPIPSGPEPVYTVAMRGLVITASGLSKQQKENIRKKVHWMGGLYNTVLTDDTTHLVSDTVISDKYVKSVEKGIPVMQESWVDKVWEASLRLNVNGASSEFKHLCLPPFANLQVTTSGLSKKDKQMVMKLVNENGGTFSGAFQSETTDIVVLNKDGVGSEKYKAALEYGKACVLPAWVKDSAALGVALPLSRYRVTGASTSSPVNCSRLPDMSLNFSRITSSSRPPSNFVDETRPVDISTMSAKIKLTLDSRKSGDTSIDKEVQTAFENLDMSCIKKAGPIFDGFCIWLTGLEGVCRERASACVSRTGGVRYECPHERVTHVVAGTKASAILAAQELPAVPVLSPIWLVRSVEAGRALDEIEYLIDTTNQPSTSAKSSARKHKIEVASPMSKRNLQLLRHGTLDLPPPVPESNLPPADDDIVNHYLSQNLEPERPKTPEPGQSSLAKTPKLKTGSSEVKTPAANVTTRPPDITDDMQDDITEEIEQVFKDMKIEVQGLDEEAICELGAEVSSAGGVLVAAGAGGSKVLVPLDFDVQELITRTAEPVTVFWVKDCLSQQELVPVQYYHQPVKLATFDGPGPLVGVVASLSTYSGVERAFLDELAKLLGATTQLRFCRRNTANALASTHLICPTPIGDKYVGAVKWGLPAVTAEWLMECSRLGRRVSERPYLVGETKAPPSPEPKEPNIKSDVGHEQTDDTSKVVTDKENAMLPPAGPSVPRRNSIPSREHTPKSKVNEGDGDMSPASRYIAMARQGLLGCDSQETPKRIQDLKDGAKQECTVRTPPLEDALSTPNLVGLSPTTRRRLQAVRRGEMPSDPIKTPKDPFDNNPETPDSDFGAALKPGSEKLSPNSRKHLWKFVQRLPGNQAKPVKESQTPLSEIRNRFLAQFNGDAPTPPSDHHTMAPRKLHLQDQAETPPSKIAKFSENQSAGGAEIASQSSSVDSVQPEKSNETIKSASSTLPPCVDAQLQRLAALSERVTSQKPRRTRDSIPMPVPEPETAGPESQPNTVGWDDTTPDNKISPAPNTKRFMLSSNVDNREEILEMIQYLGGEVCEGTELDPDATHLLCAAPGRSEKMLGSIAAGRWVLHPAYVARSRAAGKFLKEEEYEWGNPQATVLPQLSSAESVLARAAYRWRAARADNRPGPFTGVIALLHVPPARKKLLARLVAAGDGTAIEEEPPYQHAEANVCFADIKRYPLTDRDTAWLISQRIPVCAPVLLSSYLTEENPPCPKQHCLPEFRS